MIDMSIKLFNAMWKSVALVCGLFIGYAFLKHIWCGVPIRFDITTQTMYILTINYQVLCIYVIFSVKKGMTISPL